MITAITAFFARKSVQAFIGTSLEFIIKHWKLLVCAAVLAFCFVQTYNAGFASADNYWIAENARQVKALNGKIEDIEKASTTEAVDLRMKAADLQARLNALTASFPIIVAHDASGQVLKCDGKEVVPFLGSDFTESWNRLNKEGELK